jgi:biotin carboxyl carrier protein
MSDYVITLNGNKKHIQIINESEAKIGEKKIEYELKKIDPVHYLLRINNIIYEIFRLKNDEEKYLLLINGKKFETITRTRLQERAKGLIDKVSASSNHQIYIKAPMPGMILKINKSAGDKIIEDESVLILAAMKMENDLRTPESGIIKKIFVSEGNTVEKGDELFLIDT